MIKDIEKSIIKKYRKEIWSKFSKAIRNYDLVSENDKIAVCISGGKDSFLLAKCMQELQRHGKIKFDLEFIIMNPGYTEEVINRIKENLKILNIDAKIFDTPIFEIADKEKSPCYKCAKMRRGYLYDYAKKIGCNKIALGHHMDDVIETIMLGLIYNGTYSSMLPKLDSDNFENMQLIRPLYLVMEADITKWQEFNMLKFSGCACSVTKKTDGKRILMKKLLKDMEKYNKDVKRSIFTSSTNVNLNTVIGYKNENNKYNKYD